MEEAASFEIAVATLKNVLTANFPNKSNDIADMEKKLLAAGPPASPFDKRSDRFVVDGIVNVYIVIRNVFNTNTYYFSIELGIFEE